LLIAGCGGRSALVTTGGVPAFMLGEWEDDYGIRYSVESDVWLQHPRARYHVVDVHAGDRILVAQNDSDNPSEPGLWTRIDWLTLEDSGEYEWAFCYAVYEAATPEAALTTPDTQRETPRTGCNGFPFSRMKRVAPGTGASRR
jgi:hypothetical protein